MGVFSTLVLIYSLAVLCIITVTIALTVFHVAFDVVPVYICSSSPQSATSSSSAPSLPTSFLSSPSLHALHIVRPVVACLLLVHPLVSCLILVCPLVACLFLPLPPTPHHAGSLSHKLVACIIRIQKDGQIK